MRIGVLGAARIAKSALVAPARGMDDVQVYAVASRDRSKAERFASRFSVPVVHNDYDALLSDPRIDAVYIALPAALHAMWTLAAIEAGRHVLCEKPFTANGTEADAVARASASSSSVVMEAYHSGHHPLTRDLRRMIDGGVIGTVTNARSRFCVPIRPGSDIRWNEDLAGGGLLDIGYYPVRLLRELFREPTSVSATAKTRGGIDRYLTASLEFPDGVRGEIVSSMWAVTPPSAQLHVQGTAGRLTVNMPFHPQHASVRVRTNTGSWRSTPSRRSSYSFQLQAFRDAVRGEGPNITDAHSAARQMHALDSIYMAAGLSPRVGRL